MAKNFKIKDLKDSAMYSVSLIDKWDGCAEHKTMTGAELKNLTNGAGHLYDIHAMEIEAPEEKEMKRTFDFGLIDYEGRGKARNRVTVEMEYKQDGDKKRFSVSAMVWNACHSDCVCGGQCLDSIAPYMIDNPVFSEIIRLWKAYHLNDMHPECEHQHAEGWDKIASEKVTLYHWKMTPEAHKAQDDAKRAALSALEAGETFTPTEEQSFFAGLSYSLTTWTETPPAELAKWYEPKRPLYFGDTGHTETKTLGWLHENEHPDGILSKACPVCGYKYGSAWRYFPIPEADEKIIYKLLEEGSL